MDNNCDMQASPLPFSVKFMFGTMIVAGVLLAIDSLLDTFMRGKLHPLEFEAVTRSPIAGRIGSIMGSIGMPTILYWLPGYFLLKRRRKALYFCILISMFAFATFVYLSFNTGSVIFLYWDISNPVRFGYKFITFLLIPGFTFYIGFRHRSIFLRRFPKQSSK